METIERAYTTLKNLGLTKSQYDFSRDWLGRCESYMSANKARGTEPSVQSLLFLDLRLQSMRTALASVLNSRHAQEGARQLGAVREAVWLRVRQRTML
jgi:hypothetical protein